MSLGTDPFYAHGVRVPDWNTLEAWKKWNEAHPDADETTIALFAAIFRWISNASDPRNFG